MSFTLEEKIACVKRELAMRERAYPRWVDAGKMSDHKATREIMLMKAILADYEEQAEKHRSQQADLF